MGEGDRMIYLYSGTPGSGKSLHVAQKVVTRLKMLKKSVISTFDVDIEYISKKGKIKLGEFTYVPITELTPKFLYEYAFKNHKKGKEGQTLVIIDECQIIFNPRDFGRADRMGWINFFTQHRHLGYDFILVSQFDRLIDRQIRSLFEYEIKHRKINNRGLLWMLPVKTFVAITYWYGVKERISSQFFIYKKKISRIYDSYTMFDRFVQENGLNVSQKDKQLLPIDAAAEGERDTNRPTHSVETGVGGTPSSAERGGLLKRLEKLLDRRNPSDSELEQEFFKSQA